MMEGALETTALHLPYQASLVVSGCPHNSKPYFLESLLGHLIFGNSQLQAHFCISIWNYRGNILFCRRPEIPNLGAQRSDIPGEPSQRSLDTQMTNIPNRPPKTSLIVPVCLGGLPPPKDWNSQYHSQPKLQLPACSS